MYSSGLRVRSDGKVEECLFRPLPPLFLCPHCTALFDTLSNTPLEEYADSPPNFTFVDYQFSGMLLAATGKGKPKPEFLSKFDLCYGYLDASIEQLLVWVDAQISQDTPSVLPSLLYTWRRINDDREKANYARALTPKEVSSLGNLALKLSGNDDELLLLAEWYREIGQFDHSFNLLDRDFNPEYDDRVKSMIQAINIKKRAPFYFSGPSTHESIRFF